MNMDVVANALRFWELVEECLVEFYGFEREKAHSRVLSVRGQMKKAAIAQDVTYHSHPLHVASDLAQDFGPMSDAMMESYDRMVKRLASWPVLVDGSSKEIRSKRAKPSARATVRRPEAIAATR